MKKEILKYLICFGLLVNFTACFPFLYFEKVPQQNLDKDGMSAAHDKILWSCELISAKNRSPEYISFPLTTDGTFQEVISPTLNIYNNGNVWGSNVCNSIYAKYTMNGNNIVFIDILSSMVNCPSEFGSEEPMTGNEIEGLIAYNLSLVNSFDIENNTLILKNNSEILLKYLIE